MASFWGPKMNYVAIARRAIGKSTECEISEVSEERSHTKVPAFDLQINEERSFKERELVSIGPWKPATPEQVANERRRVLEEEPRTWWWMPRYRLAELERRGLSRAEAMAKVRAESGSAP
jgi:hypothetical protein